MFWALQRKSRILFWILFILSYFFSTFFYTISFVLIFWVLFFSALKSASPFLSTFFHFRDIATFMTNIDQYKPAFWKRLEKKLDSFTTHRPSLVWMKIRDPDVHVVHIWAATDCKCFRCQFLVTQNHSSRPNLQFPVWTPNPSVAPFLLGSLVYLSSLISFGN